MLAAASFKESAWKALPGANVFFFLILSSVHWPFPGLSHFLPSLAFMAVFFWSVYKPALLPYWLLFLLGLVQDSVHAAPLGCTSLIYLTLHYIVESQRRFFLRESFIGLWIMFLPLSIFTAVLTWLIYCLYYKTWLAPGDIVLQWMFTVLLYPAAHGLMHLLYSALPDSLRHAQRN